MNTKHCGVNDQAEIVNLAHVYVKLFHWSVYDQKYGHFNFFVTPRGSVLLNN